jgi:hypothetical protein
MSVASLKEPPLRGGVEQREQDGRCDVVGKVAHHAKRARLVCQQLREIHREEVRLNHTNMRRHVAGESGRQIAIDFNGHEAGDPCRQLARERAPAGPDLEDSVRGDESHHLHQTCHPCRLQEVLAESFSGARGKRWTRSSAWLVA